MRKLFLLVSGLIILMRVTNAQIVPYNCGSDKWGYKNINSNMIVADCQFSYAGTIKGGYADIAMDGKWGVVDSTGKIVIPAKYSSIWSVYKGTVVYEELSTGRRGITSVDGKVTLPPGKLKYIGSFVSGYSVIELDGKRGMIDYRGNLAVPLKYETIYPFEEGLARVENDDDKWGFVDPKGKVVVPLKYESVNNFSEGYAVVKVDGKTGIIDKKGKLISPLVWESAENFREGMAAVKKDGLYGFINLKGDQVIPCKYEALDTYQSGFINGRAVVKVNGKYGCIDKTGKEIVAPVYDTFNPFSDSLALVSKDGRKQYIDVDGKVKIDADYDEAYSFYKGMARVKKNNKYGLIRKDGAEVYPCEFTEMKEAQNGYWYAETYKSPVSIKGYIDTKGNAYYLTDKEIMAIAAKKDEFISKMDIDVSDMAKYVCFAYNKFYLGYKNATFKFGDKGETYKYTNQASDTFNIRKIGKDLVYVDINIIAGNISSTMNEKTNFRLKCRMSLRYGLISESGFTTENPGLRSIIFNTIVSEGSPKELSTIKGCYIPWENRVYFMGTIPVGNSSKNFELFANVDSSKPQSPVEKSIVDMILDLYDVPEAVREKIQ